MGPDVPLPGDCPERVIGGRFGRSLEPRPELRETAPAAGHVRSRKVSGNSTAYSRGSSAYRSMRFRVAAQAARRAMEFRAAYPTPGRSGWSGSRAKASASASRSRTLTFSPCEGRAQSRARTPKARAAPTGRYRKSTTPRTGSLFRGFRRLGATLAGLGELLAAANGCGLRHRAFSSVEAGGYGRFDRCVKLERKPPATGPEIRCGRCPGSPRTWSRLYRSPSRLGTYALVASDPPVKTASRRSYLGRGGRPREGPWPRSAQPGSCP